MPAEHDTVMDARKIKRALQRITHEILERNGGTESLAIIGVLTRGAHLAKRIAAMIEELEGVKVPVGLMDISLYRDDVHSKLDQPVVQKTDILFDVVDKHIVLVDDVLFTGRTVRAALNQIIDFGRPQTIQLAVLVDRGHRELPIKADFVGLNIPTSREDQVVLEVAEKEGTDQVYLVKGKGGKKAVTRKTARKTDKSTAKKSTKKQGGGK